MGHAISSDGHTSSSIGLKGCHCCGLVQQVPRPPEGKRAVCSRCGTTILSAARLSRSNHRTAAVALAALIFYFPAVMLPMLRVERLGHAHESSLLGGVVTLLADGHLLVGLVVLVFSVILPPVKLMILFVLSAGGSWMHHHHRARTYHLVEFIGRWGMLDVMLVAILVAFVKLGDLVDIHPGSGLLAFTACVVLSLIASLCFDPHCLWEESS